MNGKARRGAVGAATALGLAAVVAPALPASAEIHYLDETHEVDVGDFDGDGVNETCIVRVQLYYADGSEDTPALWASTQISEGPRYSPECDFFPNSTTTLRYVAVAGCRGCRTEYSLSATSGLESYIESHDPPPPAPFPYEDISSEHRALGQTWNFSIPEPK